LAISPALFAGTRRIGGAFRPLARSSMDGKSGQRRVIARSTRATICCWPAAAKAGIYGNDPEEAMYPLATKDTTGALLDSSRHNYTVTFAKGELPPVNAFWSITMYDGKTQLLIENPIKQHRVYRQPHHGQRRWMLHGGGAELPSWSECPCPADSRGGTAAGRPGISETAA